MRRYDLMRSVAAERGEDLPEVLVAGVERASGGVDHGFGRKSGYN
jgi:hypothetical protein